MAYLIYFLPALILSCIASFTVKTRFKKYNRVASTNQIRAVDAAQRLLNVNNIVDVRIESVRGYLSDHYDPRTKTLRLSEPVYHSTSLAAIGAACHEVGHALQHAQGYAPLQLRSNLVPITSLASRLGMPLILGGAVFVSSAPLLGRGALLAGVALFGLTVLFALITLPVEWDASARSKKQMVSAGILDKREEEDAGKVLNAAFLTYLGAAVGSVMTLLYYLNRLGLIGRR